jgi:hypothetical protein
MSASRWTFRKSQIVLWSGFAMPVTAMKSTRSSHACSILREE